MGEAAASTDVDEGAVDEGDVDEGMGDEGDAAEGDAQGSEFTPLLAWTFAAFHTALLVALVVALLFFAGLAGNQLAALDTSVGVVAYLYLWAVTWWTNRRMVEAVGAGLLTGSADSSAVLVEAMKWGGVAGLLVFLPVLVVGIVLIVAQGGLEAVPFLVIAASVGSVVAGGVGVVVGGVLALLDLGLVRLANVWLPRDGPERSPADA